MKWLAQNTSATPPANLYLSLHTADPGDTGASEVSTSGTGYARVACSTGTSGTGAGGVFAGAPVVAAGTYATKKVTLTNASVITWPTATASWGTIDYFGIWDALTGGNFLGSASINSVTIGAGGAPNFPIGSLSLTND